MRENKKAFGPVQSKLLKNSAEKLKLALSQSSDPTAAELLKGQLGNIIEEVINSEIIYPYKYVPHFEKMTRDYLPDIENEYFNFFSLAKFGEPAYRIEDDD